MKRLYGTAYPIVKKGLVTVVFTAERKKGKKSCWYNSMGRGVRCSGCDYCLYSNTLFFVVCWEMVKMQV